MQIANDYDKDVFNGEQGIIASINHKMVRVCEAPLTLQSTEQALVASFGVRQLPYVQAELAGSLVLSYAITVHKSQVLILHPCIP
jgi:ATP-dependent exoDNAse (exonuclease V) alpha subunit